MKIFFFFLVFLFSLTSKSWALSEEGFEVLNTFSKILHHVENDYVEPVKEKILLQGAIRGMLSTLDPHTVYLSPAVYKHLKADTAGTFGGVGLEITVRDGWITVITPIEGTPAFRSGIKPGDRILKINGKVTKGMDLGSAVGEMRGKQGSHVTLTLGREGLKQPFDVVLNRQIIRAPSVQAQLIENKFAYVKLSSFQDRTADDLGSTLKKYAKEIKTYGLILDLRNNPGGLLDQAIRVVDFFLDKGVIVTTESRSKEVDRREASIGENEIGFPLIVLVNGGSASASEIVAGALQDQKRALVLGTQTFGKGSVQSVLELDDGSALKITIARYFTPNGRSIQALGIKPDAIVEPYPPRVEQEDKRNLREEDLRGHLDAEENEPKSKKDMLVFKPTPLDYQKEVALNYLKSWERFKK